MKMKMDLDPLHDVYIYLKNIIDLNVMIETFENVTQGKHHVPGCRGGKD